MNGINRLRDMIVGCNAAWTWEIPCHSESKRYSNASAVQAVIANIREQLQSRQTFVRQKQHGNLFE